MLPRNEHPNEQWKREHWRNLNGEWEFDFDFGKSARERRLFEKSSLPLRITVPFCPESRLSGIGYTDFIPSVCYKREFELSENELSGRVFLHFGAVDYHSFIYINGTFAGEHIGGYSSFKLDITALSKCGANTLFVIAEDDLRSGHQPSGKQSCKHESYGCFYTRTTGIWQTVWLEFTPKDHVIGCKYYPDITASSLFVQGEISCPGRVELTALYDGKCVGSTVIDARYPVFNAVIPLSELHLWELGEGRLYDLEIRFRDDVVKSYFGMREFKIENGRFMLNGKTVFLRTVLDQGFYPDGIYTAKSDDELKNDIELSMNMGFNGARLHQKVFEKRFLYHCDKAGYIVWGEHANWGMNYTDPIAQGNFICEWTEIIKRDFNSPALIGWCPFNETWEYKESLVPHRLLEGVYEITKLYDPIRPCIDTSGNYHIDKRELYDVHDYEQDPDKFADYYAHISEGVVKDQVFRMNRDIQPYHGEPVFVSEYGGIRWTPNQDGWGYGNAPKTLEEYVDRYCRLTDALISNKHVMGLCYTQLYDVEQEQNGLYYYDRSPKFDKEAMEKLRSAMQKTAEIEK